MTNDESKVLLSRALKSLPFAVRNSTFDIRHSAFTKPRPSNFRDLPKFFVTIRQRLTTPMAAMDSETGHLENRLDDAALVELSLNGSRDAFGKIVERYQSLVCSLAFSACGNLGSSEELAQETFIVAWQKLKTLKEKAKFKAWLCGIARNLINNSVRKQKRRAAETHFSEYGMATVGATEPLPIEQVMSQEEESLVWQTLEGIPENYREPLVLFYRESQSVAQVASAFDLTEDNVKQRSSRGRKLLKDQVKELVETTLQRSRPGKAFTIGVLAALPTLALQAAAATVAATAAKGSVAAKSALGASMFGAVLGPIIGIAGAWFGARSSIRSARTPKERAFIVKQVWIMSSCSVGLALSVGALLLFAYSEAEMDSRFFAYALGSVIAVWTLIVIGVAFWGNRTHRRIQIEEGLWDMGSDSDGAERDQVSGKHAGWSYKSRLRFLGFPLVHINFGKGTHVESGQSRYRRGIAKGWVAIGDVAFGVLFALGGVAFGGIAVGGLALGVLAIAGLAVEGFSFGGGAVGIMSLGGAAFAWHAAYGGLAIANEFTFGGVAAAQHVNDPAANEYFANHGFFSLGQVLVRHSYLFLLFCLWPIVAAFRNRNRR